MPLGVNTHHPLAPHMNIERRITLRLLSYWEKLRDHRPMPAENDIDPEDLADLWDYCFLIHLRDLDKNDYHFSYLGSAIVEAYQGGLPVENSSGIVAPDANKLAKNYMRIVESRCPIIEEGEFRNLQNGLVKYRQCMMPLGTGNEVEAILGGMRFKVSPAT